MQSRTYYEVNCAFTFTWHVSRKHSSKQKMPYINVKVHLWSDQKLNERGRIPGNGAWSSGRVSDYVSEVYWLASGLRRDWTSCISQTTQLVRVMVDVSPRKQTLRVTWLCCKDLFFINRFKRVGYL